jgi:phage repressor protein C with HTH and peptisase S24 domain
MSSIGRIIHLERKRARITLQQVADALGVSKSYLSLIETGKRAIDEERVALIERRLCIKDGRLVAAWRWENTPAPVRRDLENLADRDQSSRALAAKLREAAKSSRRSASDRERRAALDELLRSGELRRWVEHHTANTEPPTPVGRRIPVINRVAAGYPREFTDLDYPAAIADDYVSCPDVSDPDAFAARVVGDSMAPDYREGEIVVFSPLLPTPDGSDCFVRLDRDNETTFKRVFFEKNGEIIRMEPVNRAYRPKRVKREDVGGMYAAAYVMRRVPAPANR